MRLKRHSIQLKAAVGFICNFAHERLFALINTVLARSIYSFASSGSFPSLSATFSQCDNPPSTSVHASSSECSSTHRTYSASCHPCRVCGSDTGDRTRIWWSTISGGSPAVCFAEANNVFSRNNNGLILEYQFPMACER